MRLLASDESIAIEVQMALQQSIQAPEQQSAEGAHSGNDEIEILGDLVVSLRGQPLVR